MREVRSGFCGELETTEGNGLVNDLVKSLKYIGRNVVMVCEFQNYYVQRRANLSGNVLDCLDLLKWHEF